MKREIWKKVMAVMMVGAMTFSMTGCASDTGSKGETQKTELSKTESPEESKQTDDEVVEISVFNEWVGAHVTAPYFNERLAAFNEAYPNIKVNVEEIAGSTTASMDSKLKIQISAGQLPDVFYTNDKSIADLAKDAGLLYDMKEFYDKDEEFLQDVQQEDIELWNEGKEHVYGISVGRDFFGFYYNKELLKEVGYDHFPTTWDEFYDCCDKLVAKGIAPISLCTKTAWVPSLTFLLLTASQNDKGQELAKTMGLKDYTSPEMENAATQLQSMFQKYTTVDAPGSDLDIAINHFLNEETAMLLDGTWRITSFKDPENSSEDFADKLGVAMVPEGGMINYPGMAWFSGSKDAKKAEAAYTFIRWFNNADAQVLNAKLLGGVPVSSRVDKTKFLEAIDPLLKEILDFEPNVKYTALSPWRIYPAGVTAVIPQELSALAMGQTTPKQFLENLTKAAD